MTLSLSYSAACTAGHTAHRALGELASSLTVLSQAATRDAREVERLADTLAPEDSPPEDDSPLGLAFARYGRDHAFARGDLRDYQERLLTLADDATTEVERVREIALALPLAGMAQPATPQCNGTVELVNGEPVARELFPCEREDPAALAPGEAAEIIAAVLPTLEQTLCPGERNELGAGEEAEADEEAAREHLEATAAVCREQIWTAGATTPEDEVALREAWADHHAAALPPATEAPPAPLAPAPEVVAPVPPPVEVELVVEPPGRKRPKGRGRNAKGA